MVPQHPVSVAVQWAERGVPAFPIAISWDESKQGTNKRPLTFKGHHDATADPERVRDLMADPPAAMKDGEVLGVGLLPGPAGLLVLDVDMHGGRDGYAFADSIGLPKGWPVTTASGGEHRYFRKMAGADVGNALPEGWQGFIDVRGDAGWVVAPGTSTPWGSWEAVEDFPADALALKHFDLKPYLGSNGNGHYTSTGWRRYVPERDAAALHPRIIEAHAALVEHYGVDPSLTTFQRRVDKETGEMTPYLTVTRPGKKGGTSASVGYIGPDVVNVYSSAWPGLAQGKHSLADLLPEEEAGEDWWASSVTAADLDSMTFPPIEYMVDKVLPRGGLVLLAGAPKSGKSMLAIGLSLAVAEKGMALGSIPVKHGGDVLVISLDDQSHGRAQQRLRMIAAGVPLPKNLTLHTEPNLGRGAMASARLSAYLTAHPGVVLVVIDTVEHLRPERRITESSYSADVAYLGELRKVLAKHPGVTFLCLVHTRKPANGIEDDPIEAVTGTHGITGGADHVLVLSGKRGVPKRLLDVVSRDDEDQRGVMEFTPNGWRMTGEDADDPTVLLTPDDASIYRALQNYGTSGASAVEIEAECPSVKKIGNRLASMERRGMVRKISRGKYAARSHR